MRYHRIVQEDKDSKTSIAFNSVVGVVLARVILEALPRSQVITSRAEVEKGRETISS